MDVELDTKIKGNLLNIVIRGSIDSVSSSSFRSWIEEKILEGYTKINIDLSEIEYLSSDGISIFLSIHKLLKSRGGSFSFSNISEEISFLFDFFKVDESIPIFENEEDVLKFTTNESNISPQINEKKKIQPKRKKMIFGEHLLRRSSFDKGMLDESLTVSDVLGESKENEASPVEKDIPFKENDLNNSDTEKKVELEKSHKESVDKEKEISENFQSQEKPLEAMDSNSIDEGMQEKDKDIKKTKEEVVTSVEKEIFQIKQIFCMNCGAKLNVSKPGKYICPSCRLKFDYKGN